jgi:hypothetical protein
MVNRPQAVVLSFLLVARVGLVAILVLLVMTLLAWVGGMHKPGLLG